MKKIRIYNNDEINILLKNNNVEKVMNKSKIVYKNEFKLWAVKQKINNPDMTSRQIFILGGFDMNILDEQTPQRRLCNWIKKYKMFGDDYFKETNAYSYKAITDTKTMSNKNTSDKKYNDSCKSINQNQDYYTFVIEKDKNNNLKIVRLNGGKHGKTDYEI